MPLSGNRGGLSLFLVGLPVVLVAGIGILFRVPFPDLKWDSVVVPAAVKYMETSMNVVDKVDPHQPLQGLVVAITGATSGIGLGLTRKLALLGATVVAIGRSPSKLQLLQSEWPEHVQTVVADLSDFDSVVRAADEMIQRYHHLDILINNAGIHTGGEGLFETWASKQGYDLAFTGKYEADFVYVDHCFLLFSALFLLLPIGILRLYRQSTICLTFS